MSENSKGYIRKVPGQPLKQKMNRVIDENWQKLRATHLNEVTKEISDTKKDHYTGNFRRARKKCNDIPNTVKNVHNLNNNKTNSFAQLMSPDGEVITMEFENRHNSSRNGNYDISKNVKNTKLNIDSVKKNVENQTLNEQEVNLQKTDGFKEKTFTKYIAIDCEMVGVGQDGDQNMLARVSLVNKFGDCIYDKYVKPREKVTNYRTEVSGIRKEDLIHAEDFNTVQKEVASILRNKIIVGHSVKHDLQVLFLKHARCQIRDTSFYKPFRAIKNGYTPSLKTLAKVVLGVDIQDGEHNSVEDAKTAMQLYCTVAAAWERSIRASKAGKKHRDPK